MFISGHGGYDRHGQQRTAGSYLIVACSDVRVGQHKEMRALVRYVRMHQTGHFMMGTVTVSGVKVGLSGGFGSDGLPLSQSEVGALWPHMLPVPEELATRYWTDSSGHNSVGNTSDDFRTWALNNIKVLRKTIRLNAEVV